MCFNATQGFPTFALTFGLQALQFHLNGHIRIQDFHLGSRFVVVFFH